MPQELRWIENRTGEADESVAKVLNLYGKLNTYRTRGLSDFAFRVSWGDIYETDLPIIDAGIETIDSVLEQFAPTTDNKTRIKDPFADVAP